MNVLVVGGGVMGLCAGRSLLAGGAKVRIIDAGLPGASVDHHRLIRIPYGTLTGYAAMARDAFGAWDRLWAGLGTRLIHPCDILLAGPPESDWIRASLQDLDAHEFVRVEVEEHGWRLPGRACYRVASGGMLLAAAIMDALRERLAGCLYEGRVVAIDAEAGSVRLQDGERLSADHVLVASGWRAWPEGSPQAARRPSRQPVAYLNGPEQPSAPVLLDLSQPDGFYFFPAAHGRPAKLGSHAFGPPGDGDPTCSDTEKAALEALFERTGLGRAGHRISGYGMCHYDVSPDQRFIARSEGRALWLGGFSGHGFKFAPLIGERVAGCLAGAETPESLAVWLAGRS